MLTEAVAMAISSPMLHIHIILCHTKCVCCRHAEMQTIERFNHIRYQYYVLITAMHNVALSLRLRPTSIYKTRSSAVQTDIHLFNCRNIQHDMRDDMMLIHNRLCIPYNGFVYI